MALGGVLFAIIPRRRCLLAKVAELVDALDLGSSGVTRESSSLSFRTIHRRAPVEWLPGFLFFEKQVAGAGSLPIYNDQQI